MKRWWSLSAIINTYWWQTSNVTTTPILLKAQPLVRFSFWWRMLLWTSPMSLWWDFSPLNNVIFSFSERKPREIGGRAHRKDFFNVVAHGPQALLLYNWSCISKQRKRVKRPHVLVGFSPERVSQRSYLVFLVCVCVFIFHSLLFCIISIYMHALIIVKSKDIWIQAFVIHNLWIHENFRKNHIESIWLMRFEPTIVVHLWKRKKSTPFKSAIVVHLQDKMKRQILEEG